MSIDTNNSASTRTVVDWDDAPEGATHCLIKDSGTAWFRFKDDNSFPNTWKDGEWKNVRLPTRELTPKPKQPKQLTQAVFNGLSSEYRWAYLDRDGDPVIFCDLEAEHDALFPDHQPDCYEDGLEWATWLDGVLWRTESITDVARSIEAARVADQSERTYPHYFKDVSDVDAIDLYHVARLYDIADPALFHAFKKIACAGKRGAKDQAQDVQEAIDALKRWQELNK